MSSAGGSEFRTGESGPPSSAMRVLALLAIAAALLLPLGYIFGQFWGTTSDSADFVGDERRGVAYLQPLTELLADLTNAQSVAVRGEAVDVDGLRSAVAAVDAVDATDGAELRTGERWTEVRERVLALVEQPARDRAALAQFVESVDLVLALVGKVGDTSSLILDPELGSYYLMDTALLRLPVVIVEAGRLVDVVVLEQPEQSELGPAALVDPQATVARDRVATAARAIDIGLRKSFDEVGGDSLGPEFIGRLDAFRGAADALAPSTTLFGIRSDPADVGTTVSATERLQQTSVELSVSTLVELDALLQARQGRVDAQRVTGLAAASVAGVLGLALIAFRPALLRPATSDRMHAEEDPMPPPVDEGDRDGVAADLVDARTLLESGELVRVGRAVRARGADQADDPG